MRVKRGRGLPVKDSEYTTRAAAARRSAHGLGVHARNRYRQSCRRQADADQPFDRLAAGEPPAAYVFEYQGNIVVLHTRDSPPPLVTLSREVRYSKTPFRLVARGLLEPAYSISKEWLQRYGARRTGLYRDDTRAHEGAP